MGKVPVDLRNNIATNIRRCRSNRFPKRGGSKQCAQAFGVSPQQWSQWERGRHMPDEYRMIELAKFFGVSTEYLRRDNAAASAAPLGECRKPQQAFRVVRIDSGVEVPLRVEVERVFLQNNRVIKTERIM